MAKSVLITGASSGLGFALAKEFALKGYKVYAGARTLSKMDPLKEYGAHTFVLDMCSIESIQAAKKMIELENSGVLDILYLNAGIGGITPIFDLKMERVQGMHQTNVFGPLQMIQTFQRLLLKNRSTVVFTSSTVVHVQMPFNWAYASSKTSMDLLAKHLATETGKLGIKVVNVRTGSVESEIYTPPVVPSEESLYRVGDTPLNPGFNPPKEDTIVYAKNVVSDVERALKSSKAYTEVYRGGGVALVKLMSWVPFNTSIGLMHMALKMNDSFEAIKAKIARGEY